MNIALGIIGGLVWGFLAALLNYFIMKKCIAKNTNQAMMLCNTLRMAVDIAALAVVFLVRNLLPISFTAAIVATAAGLSICTIIFTFSLMKEQK